MKTFYGWMQDKHPLDEGWFGDTKKFGYRGWWLLRNADAQTQQKFQQLLSVAKQNFPNQGDGKTMEDLLRLVDSGMEFPMAVDKELRRLSSGPQPTNGVTPLSTAQYYRPN